MFGSQCQVHETQQEQTGFKSTSKYPWDEGASPLAQAPTLCPFSSSHSGVQEKEQAAGGLGFRFEYSAQCDCQHYGQTG